jgi:hypothetical protein
VVVGSETFTGDLATRLGLRRVALVEGRSLTSCRPSLVMARPLLRSQLANAVIR